jgi:hypothetical protein
MLLLGCAEAKKRNGSSQYHLSRAIEHHSVSGCESITSNRTLCLLDKQLLHSLLGLPTLKVKTDDAFLHTLRDLGSGYCDFFLDGEIGGPTTDDFSIFF